MIRRLKLGKIAIVIFLTVLIWVWTDLALDVKLPISNVPISIAKSTDRSLWVSFTDEYLTTYFIDTIVLKGPASKIAEVERMRNEGSLDELKLFLVPEHEGITEPGNHPLNVLSFLRQSEKIKQLGITIESCEPKILVVQAIKLIEKSLPIECIDENGMPLKAEIDPAKIKAFVPTDSTLTAKVRLTPKEIDSARVSAIGKTPYIELGPGQIRETSTLVKITMPPAQDVLKEYTITTATLGFCLSDNLQGRYEVQLLNPTDMATVLIKATLAAKQAFEQQPFQMLLYILDDDAKNTNTEQRRTVYYNFPKEFIRSDEIELNQPPVQARFQLIQLPAGAAESSRQ